MSFFFFFHVTIRFRASTILHRQMKTEIWLRPLQGERTARNKTGDVGGGAFLRRPNLLVSLVIFLCGAEQLFFPWLSVERTEYPCTVSAKACSKNQGSERFRVKRKTTLDLNCRCNFFTYFGCTGMLFRNSTRRRSLSSENPCIAGFATRSCFCSLRTPDDDIRGRYPGAVASRDTVDDKQRSIITSRQKERGRDARKKMLMSPTDMQMAVCETNGPGWGFDKSAEISCSQIVAPFTSVQRNMTESRGRCARQWYHEEELLGPLFRSLGDLVARDTLIPCCVVQKNIAVLR